MNYNNRIIHFNLLKGNTYLYDSVTLESVIKFTTYCQQNKDHYAKLMLILIKTNLQTDDTQLIDITFKISEKKMIETTFRKTATIFHDRLDEFFKHKQQTPGSTPPTRLDEMLRRIRESFRRLVDQQKILVCAKDIFLGISGW